MSVDDNEKYYPHTIEWIIINRLKEFNDKPQMIKDLADRFMRLTTHTIYFKFAPLYEEAVKYYDVHNKFPDTKYFNERFPDGRVIWELNNAAFSIDMYDVLKKQLDYELIIQDFNLRIGKSDHIDIGGCREFAKRLTKFADSSIDIPVDTKEDWLKSYENFAEEYHGISTGIKALDEQVGDWGGIVTIAAPSGNGKSTFALSLAYNITTQTDDSGKGRNVLYISFEMPKNQLQANLVSIESSFSEDSKQRLRATDIKQKKLSDEQKMLYKTYITQYMQHLQNSGSYISLFDNTAMKGFTTIEEFITEIEEHSTKLGKNFDIIFIDNFDSLKMLSGERGQSDMDKMNYFITKLDAFSKTYMDGYGTCIVLLSQTNRDGVKKLKAMEESNSNNITIDSTVLQTYSGLYERASIVLVLYSSALMRANNQLKVIPVKLRTRPLPERPITLTVNWDNAYVKGYNPLPTKNKASSKIQQNSYDDIDSIDDIELDDDLDFN